jgi:uncharacterized membrane protein YdjX (TVP38/TMEM64 family)
MKVRLGVLRWLSVAVALGVLLLAQRLGVLRVLSQPEEVRDWLLTLGSLGAAVFVAVYALLQPLGVPGTVFVIAAPLIWDWPEAYLLSMLGTMLASINGFWFARFVARDALAQRIPQRFARYNQALEQHGFWTVAALRFIFWMPQVLHTFFGVSRVSFAAHFWGSLVGYALPLLVTAYFGDALFEWFRRASPSAWLGMALGGAVLLGLLWRFRRSVNVAPVSRIKDSGH